MKTDKMLSVKEGNYNNYIVSSWFETNVSGVLNSLKIATPNIYKNIIEQDFNEEGYLTLNGATEDFIIVDENFRKFILKDCIENKFFTLEQEDIISEDETKFSKEKLNKDIGGVFFLTRFNTTYGLENNCDNLGANFKINKVISSFIPNAKINPENMLLSSKYFKNELERFLNIFRDYNPNLGLNKFEVKINL